MEPQLPTPQFGPEVTPQLPPQHGEVFRVPPAGAETQRAPVEQGRETREVFQDVPSDASAAQPPATPPPLPTITPVASPAVQQVQPVDDNPIIAADDDLIEKEWVEKAKKVVAETKNDPYAQDQAIGRLQADYLQKRYGRTIKLSNDG